MSDDFRPPPRSWARKLVDAFVGMWLGARGQASFAVHAVAAVIVIAVAVSLRVARWEWVALLLCITVVLAAEMFNSALERLAKAIDRRENADLAVGLNIASSAVLTMAVGAAVCGALIFVPHLLQLLGFD